MKMYTSSELCKSCIHTKVCELDKNQSGDTFVMGHPSFFDNEELYKKFKAREKAGFPCKHYMSADVRENVHGEWKMIDEYCNHAKEFRCTNCHNSVFYDHYTRWCEYDFCPNCGADMREGEV